MTGTLETRVSEIIPRYSMLSPGTRVGVAVSGGADSVVLLHLLHRLSETLAIEPVVLHVNHRLRAEESDKDEQFVRALAQQLGLPCFVDVAEPGPGNLEQAARMARRRFFLHSALDHGLARVALGHTLSDQAETVLFRLLRGSGLTGLTAMRPVSDKLYIRPLLTTSREELRAWAREQGLSWREDSSNQDLRFRRNLLRATTLPDLARDYNPNLEKALAHTAELARAEEEFWDSQIGPVLRALTTRHRLGIVFDATALARQPLALQRRLIRAAVARTRPGLRGVEFDHIESIRALYASPAGHDRVLIPGVDAIRSFDQLLLAKPGELNAGRRHYRLELPLGQVRELPFGAGHIYLGATHPEPAIYDNFEKDKANFQTADLTNVEPARQLAFTVRNWEPGDQFHARGHASSVKVKFLFQEHRIPLWERRHWPIVVYGEEVAWVRDFGVSTRFAGGMGNPGANPEWIHIVWWPAA